jgi:hypothetical protein
VASFVSEQLLDGVSGDAGDTTGIDRWELPGANPVVDSAAADAEELRDAAGSEDWVVVDDARTARRTADRWMRHA